MGSVDTNNTTRHVGSFLWHHSEMERLSRCLDSESVWTRKELEIPKYTGMLSTGDCLLIVDEPGLLMELDFRGQCILQPGAGGTAARVTAGGIAIVLGCAPAAPGTGRRHLRALIRVSLVSM